MSIQRAQVLFAAADAVDDLARDFLFRAKRDFDAGEMTEEQWREIRGHHRQLVLGASRVEDIAHEQLGSALDSHLPRLKQATDELISVRQRLAKATKVASGLASFVVLAGAVIALAAAPNPTTVAALAKAVLDFAGAVRKMDTQDD
ncbi:MAG: hypothetical protein AAF799_46955 [Myxococcota bacterium]